VIAKVCGITRAQDALHAVNHGATALGFVFWPQSARYIAPEDAAAIVRELPGSVRTVGVFVNQSIEELLAVVRSTGITTVQLHGDESPEYAARCGSPVWRALPLHTANGSLTCWPDAMTILLDAHDPARRGGTGRPIDWTQAARVAARRPVILAGGLTPENVGEAIATVRPFGVDVSSGVEAAPGVKDPDKVARFLERVRAGFHDR
jgi:phosphoribosylanthranilate isomerase